MPLVLLTEPYPSMYARASLRGLPPRLVGVGEGVAAGIQRVVSRGCGLGKGYEGI